uniref:Tc1-like transposase DDE domain-containing protein n=1 Tax=Oryzias latipes TaxID=8090 RepID=A0A3P9L9N3_ORYLA
MSTLIPKLIFVTARLEEVGVPHVVWPAMSPDMNPIEHTWNQLRQRLDDGTPSTRDLAELHVALMQQWNASERHHEVNEDQDTSLSSCYCSKLWKYALLTWYIMLLWAVFIVGPIIWGYTYQTNKKLCLFSLIFSKIKGNFYIFH